MSRILVTGSSGYIGRPLVHALRETGHEVDISDMQLNMPFQYHEVRSLDAIIHLAALIDARASHKEANRYYRTNYVETLALIDRCALLPNPPVFIFASTGMAQHPDSPYAHSKRLTEIALDEYEYYGRHVALRLFNVAGAWKGFGEVHEPETHLIPRANTAKLTGGRITVPNAWSVRDYVYLGDVVRAFETALEADSGIYDVGTTDGYCTSTVLKMIGCDWAKTAEPSSEPQHLVADSADWLPGWEPTMDVKGMIESDMEWRKNAR